jgi:HD-GYP domain-containing protein (c-di-GMP phosphodiesterase class II)
MPVVNSVARNPDAFLLLRTIATEEDYDTRHAINSCILAVTFGRHLGLSPDELSRLALGAYLLDIGKARLPDMLLNKIGPVDIEELEVLRRHTALGLEVLKENNITDPAVVGMVGSHHERDNGDGYPARLDGNQIPVYARLAALVDCFDAITIERPYKKPLACHVALQMISEAKDVDFQEVLTKVFIRCMGAYPTGSIVELNNGFVSIVIEQNPENPRKPRVMLLRKEDSLLEDRRIIIDLGKQSASSSHGEIEITGMCTDGHPDFRTIKKTLCVPSPGAQHTRTLCADR